MEASGLDITHFLEDQQPYLTTGNLHWPRPSGIPALFHVGVLFPLTGLSSTSFGLYLCLSPSASQAAPRHSAGKFSSLFVARCLPGLARPLTTPMELTIYSFQAKNLLPEMELCASRIMVN